MLARDFGDCRDNLRNLRSVFLKLKVINKKIQSSGQGVIPDRQYSLRAKKLIWSNSITDGKVRMREDMIKQVPQEIPSYGLF